MAKKKFSKDFLIDMGKATRNPAVLSKLAKHQDAEVRVQVAKRKDMPQDAADILAQDFTKLPGSYGLQDRVASYALQPGNKISPQVLNKAASSRDKYIVAAALRHPNVTASTLAKHVRGYPYEVAAHPNTPSNVVAKLADHPDRYVVTAAAGNPNLPQQVMRKLASDTLSRKMATGDVEDVQRRLVQNPNLPADLIRRFIDHPVPNTRWFALTHPNMPREMQHELYRAGKAEHLPGLLANPSIDPAILHHAAKGILQGRLTADQPAISICGNPRAHRKTLTMLAQRLSQKPDLSNPVVTSPDATSLATTGALIKAFDNPNFPDEELRKYEGHPVEGIRNLARSARGKRKPVQESLADKLILQVLNA